MSELDKKKAPAGRFLVSYQKLENSVMVEAAGIEPASVRPLPSALHAYPGLCFNRLLPDGQGRQTAIPVSVSRFGPGRAALASL